MQFDHDHKTGKFRGWLHKHCNVGLGKFGDDITGVLQAALYLGKEGLTPQQYQQLETIYKQVVAA
jgi:hypothetical protein